jgi:F-type H+-transporting ATPase subunit delta
MNPSDPTHPPLNDGLPPLPRIADVAGRRIARVYAEALLDAVPADQADAIVEELQSLVFDLFGAQPELEAFLSNLAIGRERKAEAIRRVFQDRASGRFLNFLLVLNDHQRLDLIRAIAQQAQNLQEQRKGLLRVDVTSAVPLGDDQKDRLTGEIRQLFAREPVVNAMVDPEILGGLIVRVGDWLFDASVATQLTNIRKQLYETSSHEIQSRRDQFSHQ